MTNLHDVRAAAERIGPFVVNTPLERSAALSKWCGVDVWLKLECFQRTGSFKLRGALNALLLLTDAQRAAGVITASAGNHGLGIARAAQHVSVQATVVVPASASVAKVEALAHSGAELIQHGPTYDDAERFARDLAARSRATYVSAYNDPAVVAGGGTVGLEVLREQPGLRTIVVPAGGGGLIGGIGIVAHGSDPSVAVVGVQSVASPALYAAKRAGTHAPVDITPSLADGLSGNVERGSITLDLLRQYVVDVVLVDEQQIADAMRWLLEHEHVLVEGSAAVGVAALLARRITPLGGPLAVILSGRNVATSVLRQHFPTGVGR